MEMSTARANRDSAAMIVWAGVCFSALRVSLEAANKFVLWRVYGSRVVARQHLTIVRIKPVLLVSNGDILRDWGFIHFLLGIAMWLALSVGVLIILFKYVTPGWSRGWSENGGRMAPGAIGIVTTLMMFVCIPGTLRFLPAMGLGLTSTILGLSWLRFSVPTVARNR